MSRDNIVTGTLSLTLFEKHPPASLITRLRGLGFEETSATHRLQLVSHIRGSRYTIESNLPLKQLENNYDVTIRLPDGPMATAGKVVATPFTLILDAAASVIVIPTFAMMGVLYGLTP